MKYYLKYLFKRIIQEYPQCASNVCDSDSLSHLTVSMSTSATGAQEDQFCSHFAQSCFPGTSEVSLTGLDENKVTVRYVLKPSNVSLNMH